MIKKILFALILLILFLISCSTGDSEQDTIENICGQEPCYEGPFEPPWISAYDYDVWFVDQYQRTLTCDNRVLETENVLTFSDASIEGSMSVISSFAVSSAAISLLRAADL